MQLLGVAKDASAYLLGLFLKLLNRSLVDSTALVDQVAGGCRLAGIHMADNHDVDVNFLLRHCYASV